MQTYSIRKFDLKSMDCISYYRQVIRHEFEKPCKINVHFTLGIRMRNTLLFTGLIAILASLSAPAGAINCRLERSKTEDLICKSRDLVWLDDSLNNVYRAALAKSGMPDRVKSDQKHWISEARDACTSSACLESAYLSRISQLSSAMTSWCKSQHNNIAGNWSRVGESGFFEEFSAGPDGSFESWLHQRPEVSNGSWKLEGCNLVASSASGMSIEWKLLDLTKSELRVLEVGPVGLAKYRRSGN